MNLYFQNKTAEMLGEMLGEIQEHINKIKKRLENCSPEEFADDDNLQDGILLRLMGLCRVLKQATGANKEVDKFGILSEFPDIPWVKTKGMGDRIAHDYYALEITHPWETINNILPKIENVIKKINNTYPDVNKSFEDTIIRIKENERRKIENFKNKFCNNTKTNIVNKISDEGKDENQNNYDKYTIKHKPPKLHN